jgi:DeoR family transcriptional regulator, suf operon transcriptional repressor
MLSPESGRHRLLSLLLERKAGMSVDELADSLGMSRTAVNEHLMGLEREGYIRKGEPVRSIGRPRRRFLLTHDGANLFPKQYSWFANLLLHVLRDQVGGDRLGAYMYDLGVKMSAQYIPRLVGKNRKERVAEIVRIMNEIGFQAYETAPAESSTIPRVACRNCVYHDLAREFPEVCRFDLGVLSGMMGAEIDHEECMQRGGLACRFRFTPRS